MDGKNEKSAGQECVFRLYIARGAPESERALHNLNLIINIHKLECRTQVVDISEEPELALAERITATPTLIRVSPSPIIIIIGDLSDYTGVMRALGL